MEVQETGNFRQLQSATLSTTFQQAIKTIQKAVEVPQSQYLNQRVDIPGVTQRRVPMIRRCLGTAVVGPHDPVANQADRPETVEVQQHHCLDPVADVPVSTQHQAPTIHSGLWSFLSFRTSFVWQLWQWCWSAKVGGYSYVWMSSCLRFLKESRQ